jgi:hypothetical protein
VLVDDAELLEMSVVVEASLQPHHPGVLHVAVRVREDDVGSAVVVVDGLVWVPSSNFHR